MAKDGSLTLPRSDVSSVTFHEPTNIDDCLILHIGWGGKSYEFEWLNEKCRGASLASRPASIMEKR